MGCRWRRLAAICLLLLGVAGPVRAQTEDGSVASADEPDAAALAVPDAALAVPAPPIPPPLAPVAPVSASRLPANDPLNGGFLLVNNHGMVFHERDSDVQEDVNYARWLGAGIIRVFGTDNNSYRPWDGNRVGNR